MWEKIGTFTLHRRLQLGPGERVFRMAVAYAVVRVRGAVDQQLLQGSRRAVVAAVRTLMIRVRIPRRWTCECRRRHG
jgi:hypothetical protein